MRMMEARTDMMMDDDLAEKESGQSSASYLLWDDLSVSASAGPKRKLLNRLCGYAQTGRILAVMGPSGSGKSTFLDSLAGRMSADVKKRGNISLDGKKKGSINYKDLSYVTQENLFLGTLTVKETIAYTAHLRLSSEMTKAEIDEVVEMIIKEMGLGDCAENKIGNWHLRGISSGEKKRLSIGLEIVTHPLILLLDEPTTGLDSASAFFVARALRNIADEGRIVICSIHQPSSEVFDLFDDLLLLSSGETVFLGEAKMAIEFFADVGFACPMRRNPADHFLRCISMDFGSATATLLLSHSNYQTVASSGFSMNMKTADIKATLIQSYKSSEYSCRVRKKIQEIAATDYQVCQLNKHTNSSKWKQLRVLSHRSFINMYRDIGYSWLRIMFYVLASISTGVLYFDIGYDNGAIINRGKCVSFIYGFMICLSCGGVPFFDEELKVFYAERLNGHYGETVFVLANFLSSLPFLVAISVLSGTTIFYMVKLHPGFSHYGYFCINLFCCITVIESCMMAVTSFVPNALMAIGTGAGVIVLMMMASQIFRLLPDLPKFFWQYPMSYISFAKWAVEGQYKNVMTGLEFDSASPGEPKLKGEIILKTTFGIPTDHSKWWDVTVLLFQLFVYKLLLFLMLRYKKRVAPRLNGLHV
ncbi:ABC transporter G family member 15-like [Rhodamnia argentea]|uniref:ABC transporter G family member 15-like n=1 Tax=Rhodamnia argentea TaxID=178133 RepID=A0ABM3HQ82_9MYRT|nr:ABC transporter G family member 15-like [Rhodamnia argentea]